MAYSTLMLVIVPDETPVVLFVPDTTNGCDVGNCVPTGYPTTPGTADKIGCNAFFFASTTVLPTWSNPP
jgi:hypothetical protein